MISPKGKFTLFGDIIAFFLIFTIIKMYNINKFILYIKGDNNVIFKTSKRGIK
jgi:hypothetical protein